MHAYCNFNVILYVARSGKNAKNLSALSKVILLLKSLVGLKKGFIIKKDCLHLLHCYSICNKC